MSGPFLEAVKELLELSELLAADCDESATNLKSKTSFERRSLVRAFFAYAEATRFRLKQLALQLYDPRVNPCFSNAELALLREETYDLDRRGLPTTRGKFLPFEADLRFAFRAIAMALGGDDPLEVGGKSWEGFKVAKALRDRLTHPKTVNDCEVSIPDLVSVVHASVWLSQTMDRLLRDVACKRPLKASRGDPPTSGA